MRKNNKRNRRTAIKNEETTNNKSKGSQLAKVLDVPVSAVTKSFHLDLEMNKTAVLEGIEGVLEYSEICVKVKVFDYIVCFEGTNLEIKCMTDIAVIIEGNIKRVEYSCIGDLGNND